MLAQMLLGSALIVVTVMIHGFFMATGVAKLKSFLQHNRHPRSSWSGSLIIAAFVLWMFVASVIEIWVWAASYRALGIFDTLEEALYFSTVTMTTLGYGDIVLDPSWRLLGAFEAANGLFLFGWSTALVFAVVQAIYEDRDGARQRR